MASSFEYRPLLKNEIRLLKIKAAKEVDDAANVTKRQPIVCSIEHVYLPPAAKEFPHQEFKGRGRIWPELSATPDTNVLFKTGQDPRSNETKAGGFSQEAITAEEDLPWRHDWGDFIALSYVWGFPKREEGDPPHTITVDGSDFEVTPNLYYALVQLSQSLRIRQGFKVWVDAICINQGDIDERGQQVARMRDIYQSAWQVLIWLGPEGNDSALALSALYWLARESERLKPMEDFYHEEFSIDLRPLMIIWPTYTSPMKKAVYEALFHFFARPYWSRMWVVQEVAMGNPHTPVTCGNACISWNDVYKAVTIIAADEARFGREILNAIQPYTSASWSFEFARDRLIQERTSAPRGMWKIQQTMMQIQSQQQILSPSNDWEELVRALNLARNSLVTEEKDRVYGILGIKAIADRVQIEPDYKLTESAIYSNFAAELMSNGDLNILRLAERHGGYVPMERTHTDLPSSLQRRSTAHTLVSLVNSVSKLEGQTPIGTPCDHCLPSWAVCWSCSPAPTARLRGNYQADRNLGSMASTFVTSKTTLSAKGVVIDTLASLSACHIDETNTQYPDNSFASSYSIYGGIEGIRAALWRTIVADTIAGERDRAPESYSWLLNHRLWQRGMAGVNTCGFGLNNLMIRNRHLRLCGYTLEELIFGPRKWGSTLKRAVGNNYYNATEPQRDAFSWAVNAMAWRRLFGTENGRMGMGSCGAEVGDRIVILRGCDTPLILREISGGWMLIGECYTHGVMYGEVEAEDHQLIDIIIQ